MPLLLWNYTVISWTMDEEVSLFLHHKPFLAYEAYEFLLCRVCFTFCVLFLVLLCISQIFCYDRVQFLFFYFILFFSDIQNVFSYVKRFTYIVRCFCSRSATSLPFMFLCAGIHCKGLLLRIIDWFLNMMCLYFFLLKFCM